MGYRLARTLAATAVLDYVEITEGISIIHWNADDRVIGKTLAQVDIRKRWVLNLLAVRRPRPQEG